MHSGRTIDRAPGLREFLRRNRERLLQAWSERVRRLSPAHELPDRAIFDSIPELLDRIARVLGTDAALASQLEVGDSHALDRLERGFDLDQVVTEYALLRQVIFDEWARAEGPGIPVAEVAILDRAFDQAVRDAVARYARGRERLLEGLDRVSEAVPGTSDLDGFLRHLVRTTVDGMEAVDTAVLLVREGECLRVRAACGLEAELEGRFLLGLDEGFAGRVAACARPIALAHAAADPMVRSRVIRERGVRALYGVPLLHGGEVVGVFHVGSLVAHEFCEDDLLLVRTLASRAALVVGKAALAERVRRGEANQRFLAEASTRLNASLEYESSLAQVARLAVPAFADWCAVDLLEEGGPRRLATAHADARTEALGRTIAASYPLDLNSPVGIPKALRTGRALLVPRLTPDMIRAAAREPPHARAVESLALRSCIVVPLVSRRRVLGAISFVTAESGREYEEADLAVAEELGRCAASAIENSLLYAEAREAVQTRDHLLAVVSHDLRNQVAVVQNGARLLEHAAGAAAADVRRPLEVIARTANAMRLLVDDLLDLGAIRTGRLSLALVPALLAPLLEESVEDHRGLARERSVQLRADLHLEDVRVACDRRRVAQVLGNLLGNALKFCAEGDEVVVRGFGRGDAAVVEVADTGPGIPPDALATLFTPYPRAVARSGSGTGLGLYIAKGIVERHGGQMTCESREGEGSVFRFTLPLAR